MTQYNVIGVMSGTSLDGIDIAYCKFINNKNIWEYNIKDAHTFVYSKSWKNRLANAHLLNTYDFVKLDKEYGRFIGQKLNEFLTDKKYNVDFISSHGHTVFHSPQEKVTCQIGDGASIVAKTKITTINDFRSSDVSLHGQGAPLVPIGDELLFSKYTYCLNLGGFANVSGNVSGNRFALDICPVNIIINYLAKKKNLEYDKDGDMGKQGEIIKSLLNSLNQLSYYHCASPKSLSREWLEDNFLPIIAHTKDTTENILRTIYEHIVEQIHLSTCMKSSGEILITGGGANNSFLIELLRKKSHHDIIIPDKKLIDFKEAMIFSFLGVLRMRNEINCLSSVTGAKKDSISGAIYQALI